MILKTENIDKYSKFINLVVAPTSLLHKSLYFKFDEKTAYFLSDTMQGKLSFDFEGEKEYNKYIDYNLFSNVLSIAKTSNKDVTFEKDEFKFGKDKYKVPILDESEYDFPFMTNEDDSFNKIDFKLTNNILNQFKKVKNIIPLAEERKREVWGIFVKDSNMIVTDKFRIVNLQAENINDISISHDLLKILNLCDGTEKLEIFENETMYKVIIDNILELLILKTINLNLSIDLNDEEFAKNFKSDTTFTVKRCNFKKDIDILKTFIQSLSKDDVVFEINEDSVSIILDDNVNKIYSKKETPVESVSTELVGQKFKTSFLFVQSMLEILNTSESYTFEINPESIAFNVSDTDNAINHMVILKKNT